MHPFFYWCIPWKYSSGGILASAAAKCLPQNTQNSQNLLLGMVSHRFHRFTQMVRVRRFSHRIHRIHRTVCWGWSPTDFTDLHRWLGCVDSPTEFTDLLISGGALVSSAPTKQIVVLPQISQIYTEAANFRLVHFLLGWCTSYSVGALETSAPPERHQHLCRSVKSVGDSSQQEFRGRISTAETSTAKNNSKQRNNI